MPARTRRTVLDHAANDESMATFRQALQDPVPCVRLTAVLGLDCQRRKASPLSGDDVVADLIGLAETDPSPKVRHAALVALAQRAGDPRVRLAAGKAARDDADDLIRAVASAVVRGGRRAVRSRKALRRNAAAIHASRVAEAARQRRDLRRVMWVDLRYG
jgi:HEAT repeats